jgi:hypothetical protein
VFRKLLIALGTTAAVLFVGAWAGSPFLAARALGEAASAGDARALERLVDFPRFRDSLKSEFNARLVGEMRGRTGGDDPLAGLGALLAPTLISGAVDALVTPQAIALMVRTGRTPRPGARDADPATPEKEARRTLGYRDLNTFAIGFDEPGRPGDRALTLLMKRRGLFDWKLEAVDLPEAETEAKG